MTTKNILEKAPLTISGHFHLREEREYDDGKIVYLGNPFQMDFGDVDGIKGYYILDIPSSTYEFTENKSSPKHKKIKVILRIILINSFAKYLFIIKDLIIISKPNFHI